MTEVIYNLFAYTNGAIITDLGIDQYKIIDQGSDSEKLKFLRERALLDHATAYKARIVEPILTCAQFRAKERLGMTLAVFEELFETFNVPSNPLYALTVILNGVPRIDHTYEGKLVLNEIAGMEKISDYLVCYTTDAGINLPQLFEDDYFKAIKLLFNNGLIVSSSKLLMIFIDTMAFIEYGDVQSSFTQWLSKYTYLMPLQITEEELWEFRNGILHMSNLDSRKVLNKKVKRLIPCVNLDSMQVAPGHDDKYFDLLKLIQTIAAGLEMWLQSYNDDTPKFEKFVERYDTVISDGRTLCLEPKS
jgi:hypothetical protein